MVFFPSRIIRYRSKLCTNARHRREPVGKGPIGSVSMGLGEFGEQGDAVLASLPVPDDQLVSIEGHVLNAQPGALHELQSGAI